MSSNTRLVGEKMRRVDIAVVVAYSVLSVVWLVIHPLRAQSVEQDGAAWYLRTHLCALDRQADCGD
jgi:hypothetical protein